MSFKRLSEVLKVSLAEIKETVDLLKIDLNNRGVVLLETNEQISLGTSPEFSSLIEHLQKEELNRDLSKASLETLSIVLYKNGTNRSLIDYVRGVNSSFTLRALSIRGLVEKIVDKKDGRRYIYKPSFELLSFLGVKSVEELPDYTTVSQSLSVQEEDLKKSESEEAKDNLG